MSVETFPFDLSDIKGWVIKHKDGSIIRYNLIQREDQDKLQTTRRAPVVRYPSVGTVSRAYSFSDWCSHEPWPSGADGKPTALPIFSNGRIALYIADAPGARKVHSEYDVCIDGGNVLDVPGEHDLKILYGDPKLSSKLDKFVTRDKSKTVTGEEKTRILKIRWADRCPPPVNPGFWPALYRELDSIYEAKSKTDGSPLKVLTICQGGHGRSGSALVALMMCMTDYSPLDALTHIRALHCARAIESKDQHIYLNLVGRELGREENALEAEQVKSFKDRFLTLTSKWATPYHDRIKSGTAAKVEDRDAGYL